MVADCDGKQGQKADAKHTFRTLVTFAIVKGYRVALVL